MGHQLQLLCFEEPMDGGLPVISNLWVFYPGSILLPQLYLLSVSRQSVSVCYVLFIRAGEARSQWRADILMGCAALHAMGPCRWVRPGGSEDATLRWFWDVNSTRVWFSEHKNSCIQEVKAVSYITRQSAIICHIYATAISKNWACAFSLCL